jgi:ferredoxin
VRVRVDAAACVGHGRCYVLAPEVFSDDERGHCVVAKPEVPASLEPKARLAADNCPERAIWIGGDGG